eukprot:CCRYP_019538-RB/>CCRYP_019538-RB protein AED:0.26 eAED:0.28 QI:0/0/0/1/0/0/2/0/228
MSPNLIGDNNSRTTLLHHVRSLVQAEQGLTDALETCRPLLSHNRHHPNTSLFTSQTPPTLLPTPTSPHQIQPILALARTYSLRTSAPPTWNPSLPVVGFATPNPLPHQLRGGSLGGMQLKLAKEEKARKRTEERERRERERARKEEEERARVESLQEEDMLEEEEEEMGVTDPKKKEMMERQQRQLVGVSARNGQGKRMVGGGSKEVVVASMNLSDDSSSSEEESEDD